MSHVSHGDWMKRRCVTRRPPFRSFVLGDLCLAAIALGLVSCYLPWLTAVTNDLGAFYISQVDLYLATSNNGTVPWTGATGWPNASKGIDPCLPVAWSGVTCSCNNTCILYVFV